MSMNDEQLEKALTRNVQLDEKNFLTSTYKDGKLDIKDADDGSSKNAKEIRRIKKELVKIEKVQSQLRELEKKEQLIAFKSYWKQNSSEVRENWKKIRKENKGSSDYTLLKEFVRAAGISGVELTEKKG